MPSVRMKLERQGVSKWGWGGSGLACLDGPFAISVVFPNHLSREMGLTEVCLVVSTQLPWCSHTLNVCFL